VDGAPRTDARPVPPHPARTATSSRDPPTRPDNAPPPPAARDSARRGPASSITFSQRNRILTSSPSWRAGRMSTGPLANSGAGL
jgi:hypothetical protein